MSAPVTRVATSFSGAACGAVLLIACASMVPDARLDAMAPMGLLLVGAAWAVVGVPLALRYGGERPLGSPPKVLLAGAGAALLGLALELLVVLGPVDAARHGPSFFLAVSPFVAAAGALAAAVHLVLLRRRSGLERLGARRLTRRAFLAPLLAALGSALVVWPALERLAPRWVHDLASDGSRARMEVHALRSTALGAPAAGLARRLPQVFSGEDGEQVTVRGGVRWRLVVEDGRVAEIEVEDDVAGGLPPLPMR